MQAGPAFYHAAKIVVMAEAAAESPIARLIRSQASNKVAVPSWEEVLEIRDEREE